MFKSRELSNLQQRVATLEKQLKAIDTLVKFMEDHRDDLAIGQIETPIRRALKIDMMDPTPSHLAGTDAAPGFQVSVDAAEVVTTTDNITVSVDLQPKAQAETITLQVNAVDVLSGLE